MSIKLRVNQRHLEKTLKIIETLKADVIDRNTAKNVGEEVTDTMVKLISKGVSPIKGVGRFPEYKVNQKVSQALSDKGVNAGNFHGKHEKRLANRHNKRVKQDAQKNQYPYSVQDKYPNKRIRPVNLKLSGDMLANLVFRVVRAATGYAVDIFYDGDEDKKEQGHREGVNGQPKRPSLPSVKGEEFVVAIERIYSRIFRERIASLLKKFRNIT